MIKAMENFFFRFKSGQIYMKDAECAETLKKSIFWKFKAPPHKKNFEKKKSLTCLKRMHIFF